MKKPKKKSKAVSGKIKKPETDFAGELLKGLDAEKDGAQLLGSDGLSIKIRGVISTQVPSIDAAIGRGGIPLSRLTILHGAEGSGKTTLALHIVAECQKQGGACIYIDKEYKLDPDYAKAIGVDTNRLIIVQPPYLEKVFELSEKVIKRAAELRKETGKRPPILVVLDSMNAAIAKAVYEGDYEDRHIAPESIVYSRSLPKIISEVHKEDVALLFISQIRKKIGVMYGDTNKIAGGMAPPHWASVIIKITKSGAVSEGDSKIASKAKVEVIKNQIAPPFKKTEVEIVYGHGVNREMSLIEEAEKHGIIKRSGAWCSFEGQKLGRKKFINILRADEELFEKILSEIREKGKW